jgi:hypothetical protein
MRFCSYPPKNELMPCFLAASIDALRINGKNYEPRSVASERSRIISSVNREYWYTDK